MHGKQQSLIQRTRHVEAGTVLFLFKTSWVITEHQALNIFQQTKIQSDTRFNK